MNCLTILRTYTRPVRFNLNKLQIGFQKSFATAAKKMEKTALVFLAPGFEEIEFTTAVDVLRRGGVSVTVAGLTGKEPICGSRQILITPDVDLACINKTYDAMVLPGGLDCMKALSCSTKVGELLKLQEKETKIIAAICASPVALKEHGVCKGANVTSYPSMQKEMEAGGDYYYKTDDVVIDCNVITSRGPATAMKFALAVLRALTGEDKACEVAKGLLCI